MQTLVDAIISDIKTGTYALGDTLSQRKVGKRYGCGRWVAMRTLEDLEASSWLDGMPDGTYIVAETSDDTLRQALELRIILETYGACEVMAIADEAFMRRLRTINADMGQAGQAGDFARAVHLNRDFHMCLTEGADHGPLSRQLNAVYQTQGFTDAGNFQSKDQVFHSMCDHARMILYLKNKDVTGLSRMIRHHVRHQFEELY